MNGIWKYGLLIATVAGLVVGAWLLPAGAEEEEEPGTTLDWLATQLAKTKISLSAASDTAAKAAKGTAFAAGFEVEDGTPLYDILVLVPGTPPKLYEVEINAVTGKVVEVEEEGLDDDDDDDEKDDDEDGGDGDS